MASLSTKQNHSIARHAMWALSLAAMAVSIMLTGCGSNGGNQSSGAIIVNPGTGSVIVPGGTQCLSGQVLTQYGCLYTATCQQQYPGYGWLPGEARCVPPVAGGGSGTQTSGTFLGGLSIVNKSTFELFLQNTGRCSPNVIGWDWGNRACSSYSQAGYMVIQTGVVSGSTLPSQATVTIGAGSSAPGQPNNSGWTTATIQVPFVSPLSTYNQGFTGTGPYNFRFVVSNGLPGNSYQLTVEAIYNGTVFARGTLMAQ